MSSAEVRVSDDAGRVSGGPRPEDRLEFRAGLSLGRHLRFWVGITLVALVFVSALAAPLLAPHDPYAQDITLRFLPPGSHADGRTYILGSDELGRDLLSRIIYGTRISLIVGFGAVLLQAVVGVTFGLLAGYYRRLDSLLMRIVDVQMAIPFMVLALALVAVLGPSLRNVIIVLGFSGWVMYARVVRSEVLSVSQLDYVAAAKVLGLRGHRVLLRHVLPNVSSSILVLVTLEVPRMIIFEAALSFLGVGVQPPTPSWGGMVAGSRDYLSTAWWVSTFPGVAILLTVLGMNLLGDWVRDKLDPSIT